MALYKLPVETFELVASYLPIMALTQCGSACRAFRQVAMQMVDSLIASELEGLEGGVELRDMSMCAPLPAMLSRLHLRASLKPRQLVRGFAPQWPNRTVPCPFVINSKGPLFVEFEIITARALNGTPRIGVVDAGLLWQSPKKKVRHGWPYDLSRGYGGSDAFAMSFSPATGGISATEAALKPEDIDEHRGPASNGPRKEYYIGTLRWSELGDCRRKWNIPIRAGIFVENGKLTFYRMWTDGHWHSSGAVSEKLPSQVLPCVFLSCFVGYTQVTFVRMWSEPAQVCPGCDSLGHGLVSGWRRVIC